MMKSEWTACRATFILSLAIMAGFSTQAAVGEPPDASTQPAAELPIFRANPTPASRPATGLAAPEATSDPANPIRVELRVNTYSADAFSKLEAGCTVLVKGSVATVNFADSKLDIALNFCKIVDYYLPGKAPAKPGGITLSAPSPKELYGVFKANLEKNQSGKQWDAWLKQQYRDLVGKEVTWEISVEAKVDKAEVIKSLKADLNEMGTCLTEMKKPVMAIKHTDAWRDAYAFHPATDVPTPAEKAGWEKADIEAMEAAIRGLGKLIKNREGYPRIVNPLDSEAAAQADQVKSLRADLKDKGNRLREARKKIVIETWYQSAWRDGNLAPTGKHSRPSQDKTVQEMTNIKSLEDDIVDLCKNYGNEPG
jgi:hypothetical protein